MKTLLWVAFGVVAGFALGWLFSPGRYRHHYSASREIIVLAADGRKIGVVPKGSPLLSDAKLEETADLGWWGYVPLYFETMAKAQALGVKPGKEMSSIMDIKLNAGSASDVVSTSETQAPGEPENAK